MKKRAGRCTVSASMSQATRDRGNTAAGIIIKMAGCVEEDNMPAEIPPVEIMMEFWRQEMRKSEFERIAETMNVVSESYFHIGAFLIVFGFESIKKGIVK